MTNIVEFPEGIEDLPLHQQVFDEIIDENSGGIEPLQNWTSGHIIRLMRALDAELQDRADNARQSGADIDYYGLAQSESTVDFDGE